MASKITQENINFGTGYSLVSEKRSFEFLEYQNGLIVALDDQPNGYFGHIIKSNLTLDDYELYSQLSGNLSIAVSDLIEKDPSIQDLVASDLASFSQHLAQGVNEEIGRYDLVVNEVNKASLGLVSRLGGIASEIITLGGALGAAIGTGDPYLYALFAVGTVGEMGAAVISPEITKKVINEYNTYPTTRDGNFVIGPLQILGMALARKLYRPIILDPKDQVIQYMKDNSALENQEGHLQGLRTSLSETYDFMSGLDRTEFNDKKDLKRNKRAIRKEHKRITSLENEIASTANNINVLKTRQQRRLDAIVNPADKGLMISYEGRHMHDVEVHIGEVLGVEPSKKRKTKVKVMA